MRCAVLVLLALGALANVAVGADAVGRRLSVADAITLAQESNPAVRAGRIDVEAGQAAVRGAGAPPANPEVSLGAGARWTADGPSADVGVGISIPLNVGGTARHLKSRESARLAWSRSRLQAAELEVAVAVRAAFAETRAAEQHLAVAEQALALGLEVERAARRRHELGEASVMEPNAAALDRASAEARRSAAAGRVEQARQRLLAVLGLPAEEPLSLIADAAPSWPEALPTDPEPLVAHALLSRSDLAAAREREEASDAGLRAARSNGVPDLTLSAGWEREGDEANVVGGGVSFELPLQRNQLGVAQAEQGASRADLDATSLELQVGRDVHSALAGWRAAAEAHRVTSGSALALAEENLSLVLRAYEAGEEDLLVVLLMQKQAIDARGASIDAELELHRASAGLELALGEVVFSGSGEAR